MSSRFRLPVTSITFMFSHLMLYKKKKTYPRVYGLGTERVSVWLRARLALQKRVTRAWYQYLSHKAQADLTFMNFGYAHADTEVGRLALEAVDERNRQTIQLYNRVTSAVDLRDKDVLEVGSGRGGGAAFVHKYLDPRSMTGVDFCAKAVAFCERTHGREGLSFCKGDAERLPFPADSFDALVNVESCHCYISVDRFLEQVVRVLRKGGYFLFTDMGPKPYVDALRLQLARCGLAMVEEEVITQNVIRALEITSERNTAQINREVPRGLRKAFSNFAGVKDTPVFEAFQSGEWEYVRFVLCKA
jgi:ubiquinone/menaquinone biosynthesis C-methylase UbiE